MNKFRQSSYFWPIIVGIVTLLVVAVTLFVLISRAKDEAEMRTASDNPGSGKGTSLQHDVTDLIGSTQSTSNVVGLTLRVNQIDICQLPELTAYVAVSSEAGDIRQLNRDDIEVAVDGAVVENPRFEPIDADQQPLTATLAIDRSGSMRGAPIDSAKSATASFVDKASENDRLGVISFDHEIQVLRRPMTDFGGVRQSIDSLTVRGDTALYDAIGRAVGVTDGCSRRAVIALSDGGDTASRNYSRDEAINVANKAGIPVFMVGLKGTTYDETTLEKIAEGTGGQLFQTSSPSELAELYQRVDDQLKGQYQVKLKLDIPKTGKEHRLKITSKVEGSETTSERSFVY